MACSVDDAVAFVHHFMDSEEKEEGRSSNGSCVHGAGRFARADGKGGGSKWVLEASGGVTMRSYEWPVSF